MIHSEEVEEALLCIVIQFEEGVKYFLCIAAIYCQYVFVNMRNGFLTKNVIDNERLNQI
jgi:hypothetical protein